jgi:hypothetical protein
VFLVFYFPNPNLRSFDPVKPALRALPLRKVESVIEKLRSLPLKLELTDPLNSASGEKSREVGVDPS